VDEAATLRALCAALAQSIALLTPVLTTAGLCGGAVYYVLGRAWPALQRVALVVMAGLWLVGLFAYFAVYVWGSQGGHWRGEQIGLRVATKCGLLALALAGLTVGVVYAALTRYRSGRPRLLYVLSALIGLALLAPIVGRLWLGP